MVSILPAKRTPWNAIADAMKQFGKNAPELLEKRYQREQGLGAIDELQEELKTAGNDPTKILPLLMKAYTKNPVLERSGLGQKTLDLAGAGNFAPALKDATKGGETISRGYENQPDQNFINPISAETQQPQPATASKISEGKKTANDIDSIANSYIGEVRPDLVNPETQYGNIATFDSEIKQDLTPQEESQLRQQLFDKYKNPAIVNPVVDRIREGIKNRYNEALSKYGFDKEKREQIQKKWEDFSKGTPQRLKPHLEKFGEEFPKTKEVLQNKYNQYAGALTTNMTPEQMHTNSMALLQKDIDKIDALHALPSMPPVRNVQDVKDYIDTNKEAYKDLADMGFTDALKEDTIINKDMGNEEFHSLIWGDQTSKPLLNLIHGFKAPKEYERVKSPAIPMGYEKYNSDYPKQKEKYISDLSNALKRLKPKDDLILSRAMVLDNGGNIKDFGDALKMAQQNGLKLSEFQKGQLQEINIPRSPPLWELFQPEGLLISPFINYLRGKR